MSMCEHGLAARRASEGSKARLLLVSPTSQAHFPGCHHKGDDPDVTKWGEIVDVPDAWTRLGNGERIPANGGARPDRVATDRCRDCVYHGPW